MSTPSQANPPPEPVPQVDLAAQYAAIGAEIRAAVAQEVLSLPIYPELRQEQMARVVETII